MAREAAAVSAGCHCPAKKSPEEDEGLKGALAPSVAVGPGSAWLSQLCRLRARRPRLRSHRFPFQMMVCWRLSHSGSQLLAGVRGPSREGDVSSLVACGNAQRHAWFGRGMLRHVTRLVGAITQGFGGAGRGEKGKGRGPRNAGGSV